MEFSVAGIQKINEGLLQALNEELGLVGVFVVPKDIDRQDGTDNREDPDSLVFLVITNIIEEVRTLASGTRVGDDAEIDPEERINHPVHNRIRERAPVQPGELLTRESLEAFGCGAFSASRKNC